MISKKIKSINQLSHIINAQKSQGKNTVLVHGIFDILHRGHLELLKRAKKIGDILIVGIDHDINAKMIKGKNRPINHHTNRLLIISSIEYVDYAFLIPPFKKRGDVGIFYDNIYEKLKPSIIATSVSAGKHGLLKKRQAKKIGAKFVDIKHKFTDISTTIIVEKLGLE